MPCTEPIKAAGHYAIFDLLSARLEEILQHKPGLVLENSGDHLGMMVYSGVAENAELGASAALRIGKPPYHRIVASKDDRARAHRTRLLGDIKPGARKPPVENKSIHNYTQTSRD